jgi:hypothetical protein
MNKYERLQHGESFKMSDFKEDRPFYLNVINGLRAGEITGQYDFEGEMHLSKPKPIPLTPHQEYLIKRQEALSLIVNEGVA